MVSAGEIDNKIAGDGDANKMEKMECKKWSLTSHETFRHTLAMGVRKDNNQTTNRVTNDRPTGDLLGSPPATPELLPTKQLDASRIIFSTLHKK